MPANGFSHHFSQHSAQLCLVCIESKGGPQDDRNNGNVAIGQKDCLFFAAAVDGDKPAERVESAGVGGENLLLLCFALHGCVA